MSSAIDDEFIRGLMGPETKDERPALIDIPKKITREDLMGTIDIPSKCQRLYQQNPREVVKRYELSNDPVEIDLLCGQDMDMILSKAFILGFKYCCWKHMLCHFLSSNIYQIIKDYIAPDNRRVRIVKPDGSFDYYRPRYADKDARHDYGEYDFWEHEDDHIQKLRKNDEF